MVGCAVSTKEVVPLYKKIISLLTTNIAVLIPIIASAAGVTARVFYKNGGLKNMWRKFKLNKDKTALELEIETERKAFEAEKRALILKEIKELEEIIDLLRKEKEVALNEVMREKLENKIYEIKKKKQELFLEL